MFDYADTRHSRFVARAKVILPIIALAILSTVFLFARSPNSSGPVPYADGTVEDLAREPRLSGPTYTGVTGSGARIEVSAGTVQPSDAGATVTMLTGRIEEPDGTTISITAAFGEFDESESRIGFTQSARAETSTGYTVETSGFDADLTSGRVTSHGDVSVAAPEGHLTAGQVTFEPATEDQGARMLFTDGVKLVYVPKPED